jgi:PAS domain S-box-containing protein
MRINFERLFQQSPNPYMLVDRELRYVAANDAYLRVTGTTFQDLFGHTIFEVFPNDPSNPNNESVQLLRRSLERALETGEPDALAFIPYRVPRHIDGRVELVNRYWSATHTPIRDDRGGVAFVLQHTVDVTDIRELQQAAGPASPERAIVESDVLGRARRVQEANVLLDVERRHLRELFEQAPGFICFLRGPEHVFEIANAAYLQLVGHRDIVGKPVREALPEVAGQGFYELLDDVFATGRTFTGSGMRVVLHREPGAEPEEAFLDFVYQPIRDLAGRVTGIFVQGYDITTQKRQEAERSSLLERERSAREAAEAAEERQRFLAESIPQQVWTARPDGDVDFVNQRVVEYFGASRDALLGEGWHAFVHPDDAARCAEQWQHSLRTGDPYEVEFRLKRADGAYRWHLGRALPLRHADQIEKWFGTNTDMDDLTRAREELQARAELDQQMIGIVSHDLRNPLNAIGMATALLLHRGRLDEQQVKIVTRIMSSTERAGRLIRDFLDFTEARVSGRIPVVPAKANIREIATQVFEEVHLAYPGRAAHLRHTGDEAGVWDADRLAQLIGNLLGNAFQHGSPEGAVSLITRGEGDEVVIEVHNDGSPIPDEDRAQLFEPFQRGHAGGGPGRSIGLGLFIADQIARSHGGAIAVHSTAAEGTRFTVRLPKHPPAAGDERQ